MGTKLLGFVTKPRGGELNYEGGKLNWKAVRIGWKVFHGIQKAIRFSREAIRGTREVDDYVMLSGAKHHYYGVRDPSVAEKRSLRVT